MELLYESHHEDDFFQLFSIAFLSGWSLPFLFQTLILYWNIVSMLTYCCEFKRVLITKKTKDISSPVASTTLTWVADKFVLYEGFHMRKIKMWRFMRWRLGRSLVLIKRLFSSKSTGQQPCYLQSENSKFVRLLFLCL